MRGFYASAEARKAHRDGASLAWAVAGATWAARCALACANCEIRRGYHCLWLLGHCTKWATLIRLGLASPFMHPPVGSFFEEDTCDGE